MNKNMNKELEKMNHELSEVLAELMANKTQKSDTDNLPLDYDEYVKNHFSEKNKKFFDFRISLSDESDRGCALFSASFLEYELENLLREYLVNDISVSKNVFAFNGPLGTFSGKIDMTYLLGLIGKKAHRDLHLIRKVRNEFGHNHEFITFESEKIKGMCREFYYTFFNSEASSRKNFTSVVCGVLGIIIAKQISIKKINSARDFEITDEFKENTTMFLKRILYLNISHK